MGRLCMTYWTSLRKTVLNIFFLILQFKMGGRLHIKHPYTQFIEYIFLIICFCFSGVVKDFYVYLVSLKKILFNQHRLFIIIISSAATLGIFRACLYVFKCLKGKSHVCSNIFWGEYQLSLLLLLNYVLGPLIKVK